MAYRYCTKHKALVPLGAPCAKCSQSRGPRPDSRPSAHKRGYDAAWRRVRAAAIATQPWCSVCQITTDLTGDHITPLSKGGKNTADNVRVLCRSCNSRKGNRSR